MTRTQSQYGYPLLTLTEAYTQALVNAGACPLLIPLGLPEPMLSHLIDRLDGILFTGGGDVHPDRYGSQEHPLVSDVDEDRDGVEIHLLNVVMQRKLPFMGVCRGLQVINVAMGGTLYEDILDQHPGALQHSLFPQMPRDFLAHKIEIVPTSKIARILGDTYSTVNSMHHQGIRELAPGLCATAFAPDGVIEAFEVEGHPFGLAVQWHPEWLREDTAMVDLFHTFARVAQGNESG